MRCPICDWSIDGVPSIFNDGLAMNHDKALKIDDKGNVFCGCGMEDEVEEFPEEDLEEYEEDLDNLEKVG